MARSAPLRPAPARWGFGYVGPLLLLGHGVGLRQALITADYQAGKKQSAKKVQLWIFIFLLFYGFCSCLRKSIFELSEPVLLRKFSPVWESAVVIAVVVIACAYKHKQTRDTRVFLPFSMRADLDIFLMDLKLNMANLFPAVGHFYFWQKKNSEFTKRNFGCEFGNFSAKQKNVLRWEKKSAMFGFRSTKNHPNRPA